LFGARCPVVAVDPDQGVHVLGNLTPPLAIRIFEIAGIDVVLGPFAEGRLRRSLRWRYPVKRSSGTSTYCHNRSFPRSPPLSIKLLIDHGSHTLGHLHVFF
jgi:hypothetical protein